MSTVIKNNKIIKKSAHKKNLQQLTFCKGVASKKVRLHWLVSMNYL